MRSSLVDAGPGEEKCLGLLLSQILQPWWLDIPKPDSEKATRNGWSLRDMGYQFVK
jgi:hypothetical protein